MNEIVRTRFAPSPTGTPESVHLGFVIRALWNFALAKQNNGQFILRIEDTDKARSRNDTEQSIYETLKIFGIYWDEGPDIAGDYGPYKQSERLDLYQKYAHNLVELGSAYYDFDATIRSKEEIKEQYDNDDKKENLKIKPEARYLSEQVGFLDEAKKRIANGEKYVIRVKMPMNGICKWRDWILKKDIEIKYEEVQDLVILKSDGYPTYHLAVVVDDTLMKISHVLRGFEWISTTPIHIFLYKSLGLKIPNIGHFPVILDPKTKKKFSKRDLEGMFGVKKWIEDGYLPEALLNYLMLLGWAPKDNSEIYSLEQFVHAFSQEGIQKSNPMFDSKKMDWFQGQYIRNLSPEELKTKILRFNEDYNNSINKAIIQNLLQSDKSIEIVKLLQERTLTLMDFIQEISNFDSLNFVDKIENVKGLKDMSNEQILALLSDLNNINFVDEDKWQNDIRNLSEKYIWKAADVFMLLRYAVWGKAFSPPLFETIQILGVDETKKRINSLPSKFRK